MPYYLSRSVLMSFEEAEQKTRELLAAEGFGVLTEIDVQNTLKKKLNVDFKKYKILGACNPPFAYKALLAESKIGLMLPCNVILQELSERHVEVAAIDPVFTIAAIGNENLNTIANQIREKLISVIEKV